MKTHLRNASNQSFRYQRNSIIATGILFMATVIVSILFLYATVRYVQRDCYERLTSTTKSVITELEYNMRNERMMLRMLAGIIAEQEQISSRESRRYMAVYESNSSISHIGLLLPNSLLSTVDFEDKEVSDCIDFALEAGKGEHFCGDQKDLENPGNNVVRCYVPIRKNNETIALIYGEAKPANIIGAWISDFYEGSGHIEIVDRRNGRIIISSDGKEGSLFADLHYTPSQKGVTLNKVKEEMIEGTGGYGTFKNEETGGYYYLCYEPMEIASWTVVLCVPGAQVFANALTTERYLSYYLITLGVLFMIYFLWILSSTRKSIAESEKLAGTDALTGALNRNSYEFMIKQTDTAPTGTCCIYVDINGLHELNNDKGHVAGDRMLQYVSDQLRGTFGSDQVYRTGGDEFIIFCLGRDKTELIREFKEIKETLEKHDYHISVGIAVADAGEKMKELVRSAEARMFIDKRAFYEAHDRRMR
ncbi:MAG: sensor domain-containing diguanylate cyclase [Lachnospiraceae bacterium]|nr:sensor domain-containing diguanylate cyclase [Lachnospiraceae bacterium]